MARRTARADVNFMTAVVGGRARPPRVSLVAGYQGATALHGHTRIYTSLDLQHWVDVRKRDVVHSAPEGGGPWTRTLHWVKVNAPVTYGSTVMKDWKGRMGGDARNPGADQRAARVGRIQELCDTSLSETCQNPLTAPTRCFCPRTIGQAYCPTGPLGAEPFTRDCPGHGDF